MRRLAWLAGGLCIGPRDPTVSNTISPNQLRHHVCLISCHLDPFIPPAITGMAFFHMISLFFSTQKRYKNQPSPLPTPLLDGNFIVQEARLLNLPLDLVVQIFETLPLYAKIIFSQLCRDGWRLFCERSRVAFQKASRDERLECQFNLGSVLPEHWSCLSCRRLHLTDVRDIPRQVYELYEPCPAPASIENEHLLSSSYPLTFGQVQQAVKYTRLNNIHQCYRSKLLQRFITTRTNVVMHLRLTAEPKVVHGRFLLKSTFEICKQDGWDSFHRQRFEIMSLQSSIFCRHLSSFPCNIREDILYDVRRAGFDITENPLGQEGSDYACDKCHTDYKILSRESGVVIVMWRDLGTGMSPTEAYWQTQLPTVRNNEFTESPLIGYYPGAVKDMYNNSEGQP